MLAVKLHKSKQLTLSSNTYLIPILNWKTAKPVIKNWYKYLNRGRGRKNTSIEYISLVKIPDDHPVAIYLRSSAKTFTDHVFTPLKDIPKEEMEEFCIEYRKVIERGGLVGPEDLPELVLGAPLSKNHIIWTKRIQLLYSREKNVKVRKFRRNKCR